MTVNTVVQVVGSKIKITEYLKLINVQIPEDQDEILNWISDHNGDQIDEDFNIRTFHLTHDIVDEKEADEYIILGIPLLVYDVRSGFGYSIPEKFEIDFEKVTENRQVMKDWLDEKRIDADIKLYLIIDDCGCCS